MLINLSRIFTDGNWFIINEQSSQNVYTRMPEKKDNLLSELISSPCTNNSNSLASIAPQILGSSALIPVMKGTACDDLGFIPMH